MNRSNSTQRKSEKLHSAVYKKALLALAALATLGVLVYSVSTAWYSNVAETKGMIIETDTWGFDGQMQVREMADPISPGGSGYVDMQISNDSDEINMLYVTADKSEMSEELQKRIYFYVPSTSKINEETVDRVYLSPYNSFAYTVMPKSTLLLSKEHTAATPVCYEWVYDLEGYYVYGTLAEKQGKYSFAGKDSASQPIYLRPVTYDFTKATFDDSGNLATVDGTTTTQEFLNTLAKKDGYEGLGTREGSSNYYPVSVKENGDGTKTGVWIYLCTQTEIEKATELDTRIGEYAYRVKNELSTEDYGDIKALKYNVQLKVSAQNLRAVDTSVSNEADLLAALASTGEGDYQRIALTNDLELTDTLTIAGDRKVILDLNGKTVRAAAGSKTPVLEAAPGSQVTVMDGTIDGANCLSAVHTVGAEMSFSDVKIRGTLLIEDGAVSNTEKRTSLVRVYCSELVSDGETGIHVYGNGSENSQLTALIVENSKIQAAAIGICGNGSQNSYGTDIQVRNSTVSGKWAGIYQPQQKSKLSVFGNSMVEGITALAIKGGTVTVLDSTVQSTAESTTNGLIKNPTDTQLSKNGFVDTGAAVYVEANYNWADSIRVKINNSTVSSAVNTPVLVLGPQKDKVVLTQVDVKQ